MVLNLTRPRPKSRQHIVILKVYDDFTSKFTGVELRVKVDAIHAMEARLKAKMKYEYFLHGSPSFTFHDGA